nr:PREDICTED: probable G-protein coupled receptor CG31760 isoform X1 [Bemisia tabaci]
MMDEPRAILVLFLCFIFRSTAEDFLLTSTKDDVEASLRAIRDVNVGSKCESDEHVILSAPISTHPYDTARKKADLFSLILKKGQFSHPNLHTIAESLLISDQHLTATRVLSISANSSETDAVIRDIISWNRFVSERMEVVSNGEDHIGPATRLDGLVPTDREWFDNGLLPGSDYDGVLPLGPLKRRKFMSYTTESFTRGWWTFPYYSCAKRKWLLSYSVLLPSSKQGIREFLSFDVDISDLKLDQCESPFHSTSSEQMNVFLGSHKCHNDTTYCLPHESSQGWMTGSYSCHCKPGFYSLSHHSGFEGVLVEEAWAEYEKNLSQGYRLNFTCKPCAAGCETCRSSDPCLAPYNWPFRITLLSISIFCAFFSLCLIGFVYKNRKVKVFKVASPVFLSITLFGCSIMYLEMAAIFPVLDKISCSFTKWLRHFGFCVTYSALLMKTWRVSLTHRVKSAHKVKLTDHQLLQWMVPILLVIIIYLSTWTLNDPPHGVNIRDYRGLLFKQCSYNWWDHSLAAGEVLFLAWGVRVCYNVRNAESLYNEARMISYAIYNIAAVNIFMVSLHLFILPNASPDGKYFLGFIRTQCSTSVTIALIFGPKVMRVMRGQGDQLDNKAKARAVTASFSPNGVGFLPEPTTDPYQENEELKEEIQKLAAQIEFMKIIQMQLNNRHLKPKAGGYFNYSNTAVHLQSPLGKSPPFSKTECSAILQEDKDKAIA